MLRRFGLCWLSAQWQPHSDQLQQWIAASASNAEALTLARTYIYGLDVDAAVAELQDAVDLFALCHKVSYPGGSHVSRQLHSFFDAKAGQLDARLVQDIARLGIQYPSLMAEFCQLASTQSNVLRRLDTVLSSLSMESVFNFAEAVWAARRVTISTRQSVGVYRAVLFSLSQTLAHRLRSVASKGSQQEVLQLLMRLAELRAPLWVGTKESTSVVSASTDVSECNVSCINSAQGSHGHEALPISLMTRLSQEVLRCTRTKMDGLQFIVPLLQVLARACTTTTTTVSTTTADVSTTPTMPSATSLVCFTPWMNLLQSLLCKHVKRDTSGMCVAHALQALSAAHMTLQDKLLRQLRPCAAHCSLSALRILVTVCDTYAIRQGLVQQTHHGINAEEQTAVPCRELHAWHEVLRQRVRNELLSAQAHSLSVTHTLPLLAMLSILDPEGARAMMHSLTSSHDIVAASLSSAKTVSNTKESEEYELVYWACVLLYRTDTFTTAPSIVLRRIAACAAAPVKSLTRLQAIYVCYVCLRAKLRFSSQDFLPHMLRGVTGRKFVHRNGLTRRAKGRVGTSTRTSHGNTPSSSNNGIDNKDTLVLTSPQQRTQLDGEEERLDVQALYLLCECVLHDISNNNNNTSTAADTNMTRAEKTNYLDTLVTLLRATQLDKNESVFLLRQLQRSHIAASSAHTSNTSNTVNCESDQAVVVRRVGLSLQLAQLLVQRHLPQLCADEVVDVMEAYAAAECRDAVTLQALLNRLHTARGVPVGLIGRAIWASRRLRLVPQLTRSGLLDTLAINITTTTTNGECTLVQSGAELIELLHCCPPVERHRVMRNVPHSHALLSALALTSLGTSALCVLLGLSGTRDNPLDTSAVSSVVDDDKGGNRDSSNGALDADTLLYELSKRPPLQLPQSQHVTTNVSTSVNEATISTSNISSSGSSTPSVCVGAELTAEDVVCALEALPHTAEVLRIMFRTFGAVLASAEEAQLLRLYHIICACRDDCPLVVFRTLGKALLHAVPQMTIDQALLWLTLYATRQIRDDSVGKALIRRICARNVVLTERLARQFERDARFYGLDVTGRVQTTRKKRKERPSMWLIGRANNAME